ncbi:MAG TPA: hypothetical protein PLV42_12695 [bacterium]|nr:hypothetical protein [bacterium]
MKVALITALLLVVLPLKAVDFDFDRTLERFDEGKFIGGGAGFSHEGDDELFGVTILGEFRWEPAGFGFNVPLRWLVYDENNDTDTVIGMPTYDWDDVRDYVRLITYAQYGHPDDEVYLYFGEHENRYIGHGTLVGGYFNNIRLARPSRGIYTLFQTDWAGGELMLSDVAPPDIIGGRAYLKPWSFIDKESYANNWEIGVSWFSDIFMPEEVTRDLVGSWAVDRVFDSAIGIDTSFRFLAFDGWHLTPYFDWNLLRFAGNGIHGGIMQTFDIPLGGGDDLRIETKFEGRIFERDYSPQYFGTFYDIEKYYFFDDKTKYRTHASPLLGNGPWYTGWYGDVVFTMVDLFAVGGSFEWNEYLDTTRGGHRTGRFGVNLFGDLILFDRLRFSLFFTRADAGRGEFFDITHTRSLLSTSVAYTINEYMGVSVRVGNGYRLDTAAGLNGRYRSEIQFGIGFTAGYGF